MTLNLNNASIQDLVTELISREDVTSQQISFPQEYNIDISGETESNDGWRGDGPSMIITVSNFSSKGVE